jgi:alanyl-tRNA synthetase
LLLYWDRKFEGKANLVVLLNDDLQKEGRIDASAIVREIAGEIRGGGGGQPFLATAGGKNPAGIDAALRKAADYLERI